VDDSLAGRLEQCIRRDHTLGMGLARELEARAPQMADNVAALDGAERATSNGHPIDAAEAERRLEEAAYFRQVVENIGIMILRAEGLESDPARSRDLMQQWFDLGSIQEGLEAIRARWGALIQ
jgi:hypothetical protein